MSTHFLGALGILERKESVELLLLSIFQHAHLLVVTPGALRHRPQYCNLSSTTAVVSVVHGEITPTGEAFSVAPISRGLRALCYRATHIGRSRVQLVGNVVCSE